MKMDTYFEKTLTRVKIIRFFIWIVFILLLTSLVLLGLNFFRIIDIYYTRATTIRTKMVFAYLIVGLFILWLVLLIVKKVLNKRRNIKFDGTIISFCHGKEIEYEFDIKKIDELFNYRSNEEIPYSYHDAMVFRFHKNEVWTSIDSTLYNQVSKKSSIQLIREINDVYANIKFQRAIKELDESQGVRFKYLKVGNEQDFNEVLTSFEKSFASYNNTYGAFESDRIVITKNSLYYNKECIATINNGDYMCVKPFEFKDDYYHSDVLEFYNKDDILIKEIDLALVVNSQLFKTLAKAIFEK